MGLSISEIVEQAHNETERKIDQAKVDLSMALHQIIQQMLDQNRFWWARGTATLSTTAGVQEYDLTSSSLTNRTDIGEIEKVYLIESESSISELTPALDPEEMVFALAATTNKKPARFFIKPDTFATLMLANPADNTYTLRLLFWRAHNPRFSEAGDTIPIVPGWLHYGLVIGLKRRIYELLYGQGDERFVVANAEWVQFLKDAQRRASFSSEFVREWSSGEAIRSF